MSAGSIPVFVVRDYVKPFTELVDWSAFSFSFSPDEVPNMLRTLRSVSSEELLVMQVTGAITQCRVIIAILRWSLIERCKEDRFFVEQTSI